MHLSIAQIESLMASEFTQATQEVHNFVAFLKGKDAEVKAAETEFATLVERQKAIATILLHAGYTVNAGSISAPAAA